MLWDPFLIKKLLKSVICGTVNSTHALFTVDKVNYCGLKKKKKKRKTWRRNVDMGFIANQIVTECLCESHMLDYAWKKLTERKQERYQSSKNPTS